MDKLYQLKYEIEGLCKKYEEAMENPSFASYEASLIAKGKQRQREDILRLIDEMQKEPKPKPCFDWKAPKDMGVDHVGQINFK